MVNNIDTSEEDTTGLTSELNTQDLLKTFKLDLISRSEITEEDYNLYEKKIRSSYSSKLKNLNEFMQIIIITFVVKIIKTMSAGGNLELAILEFKRLLKDNDEGETENLESFITSFNLISRESIIDGLKKSIRNTILSPV